jgi:kinesin family protein 1
MIGYGKNKGIVPMATEEIFARISANTDPKNKYEVSFSMLEIYMEKVSDLLVKDPSKRPQGGLKIREDKKRGVFV